MILLKNAKVYTPGYAGKRDVLIGGERILIAGNPLYLHSNILKKEYEVVDIPNVGNIPYYHLLGSDQGGKYHLKSLVLGPLRCYLTL